ncbi:hypothetical protein R6L23_30885, partial [Streptomyces sp. SR27]|nr:hypothetical protein [Streptomyces sp. SR27]
AAPALALPPAAPVPPASTMVPAVPTATAIVPYAARRPVPRPEGGFDFFGTQKAAAAIEAVQNTDLADVVGEEVLEEVLAAQAALGAPLLTPISPSGTPVNPLPPRVTPSRAVGQVIDLTAHDETEQLDLAELRGAVNS